MCVAFLWQGGGMTALPTLGGNNAFGTGINSTIDSDSNIYVKQFGAGNPVTIYIDGFTMVTGSTPLTYVPPAAGLQTSTCWKTYLTAR